MNLLITGGCGFLGRHLAKRASENGFEVTTLDRDGSPDICAELPAECPDLSQYEIVVHLAFEPRASALAVTESLFKSLGSSGNLKRVFMICPPDDGSARRVIAWSNTDYAKALAEELQIPLTVIRSANVFGPGGHSLVDQWISERGTISTVPRGTFQIVPVSFLCDFMSEILPATDWLPPNNELVVSTVETLSRAMIAKVIKSLVGGDTFLIDGKSEERLDPVPAHEAFGLPVCSEDRVLSEIGAYIAAQKVEPTAQQQLLNRSDF